MSELLSGKVVFVTGAGHPKGIGRACANMLADNSATVVIADLHDNADLQSFDQGLKLVCDVTNKKSIEGAVNAVISQYGRIDAVINNAGVGVGDPDFLKLTDRDWDLSLSVNLRGVANVCDAIIPHMVKASGGSIINIASLSGLGAINGIPACYTASKFAVIGLTKQLALQFASKNIRCNAICPGSVNTQMMDIAMSHLAELEGISIEDAQKLEASGIPFGRAAEPSEIAGLALFLVSDTAQYLTGTAIPVSGGMSPGI